MSDSEFSPEKPPVRNPRSEAALPSQRPDLGESAPPPLPPAAVNPPRVEMQGRRLSHWFHRTLPDYFYMDDISTVGALVRARFKAARSRDAAEAQIEDGAEAQLELRDEGRKEECEEVEMLEDDVPWCR